MIKVINSGIEATIQLFGDIGVSMFSDGWTLDKFNAELKAITAPTINIEIKSPGGDVFEAFAIYDAIKSMKPKVIVNIVGTSASAATIIASAADLVTITENSRYLVHNAQTFVEGNKEKMADKIEELTSIDNQILDVYVKKTGKSKDILSNLMTEERWLTAQEALTWGFVDQIIENKQKVLNSKIENIMTPEEVAALQAENEALKAKVEELSAQVLEYEQAQQGIADAEIEAVIEEAVTDGKIEASAKDYFSNYAKSAGKEAIVSMFAAIKIAPKVVDLLKVVDPKSGTPEPMNIAKFQANFKAGVYNSDKAKYHADFKQAYGYESVIN